MRNLDHVGNLESLLDELDYMQYICVCVGGGGSLGMWRPLRVHLWEIGGEVESMWGSGGHWHCEGCGSRGRSGWYLVIKGGDVGSQEEIGRKRVRLRLYWGVEVGGEEYIGNNVRETSTVRDY